MPALASTALKTAIEGLGLGVPVYRGPAGDDPGPGGGPKFPRIEIAEGIADLRDADGDQGDPNAVHTKTETMQVDVWQLDVVPGSNPPTRAESLTLVGDLERGLSRMGALGTFGTPARRIYGVVLRSSLRIADPTPHVLHQALTVDVYREI